MKRVINNKMLFPDFYFKSLSYQLSRTDSNKLMFMQWHKMRFSVDPDEIRRLGKRFKKLDLDNSGSLSVEEFMSLPELQQNPLVQRVIDIFDTDGNGEVDFKGQIVFVVFLVLEKFRFVWQFELLVMLYVNSDVCTKKIINLIRMEQCKRLEKQGKETHSV